MLPGTSMDWKEFTSSVVSSLAWPAAIAFIVYLFRRPIGDIFERLRKLSYKGAAAEFEHELGLAETAAKHADITTTPNAGSSSDWSTSLGSAGWGESSSLAEGSPRAAVIEAWIRLERELVELAQSWGIDIGTRRLSTSTLVRELEVQGAIDLSLGEVIERLRRTRNVAVHEERYPVSPSDAAEYVRLSESVAATLGKVRVDKLAES